MRNRQLNQSSDLKSHFNKKNTGPDKGLHKIEDKKIGDCSLSWSSDYSNLTNLEQQTTGGLNINNSESAFKTK